MALTVSRRSIKLKPDYKKVIPGFLNTGNDSSLLLIHKILQLNDKVAETLLNYILMHHSK
jgi:hypothetical protein